MSNVEVFAFLSPVTMLGISSKLGILTEIYPAV